MDREIRKLGTALRKVAGLDRAPELLDAIDVLFVLGWPVPRVSLGKLAEWVAFRRQRSRIAVLTEISREAAFGGGIWPQYRQLRRTCMSRRRESHLEIHP